MKKFLTNENKLTLKIHQVIKEETTLSMSQTKQKKKLSL